MPHRNQEKCNNSLDNMTFAKVLRIDPYKYKVSRYNIYKKTSDKALLIFNTKTGAFSILTSQFINTEDKERYLADFVKNGYIIEKERNERGEVIENFKKVTDDKTIMRLIILPAEMCNFRCIYCYETFSGRKMPNEIATAIVKFVYRHIKELKTLEISWFGGEPLLATETVVSITQECQRLARANGVKFLADVTTNGYLLTPKLYQNLIAVGITGYQVTIDGIAEVHNQYRKLKKGGDTFQRIWKNLCALKKLNDEIYVIVRTNFDQNSTYKLDEWINLYSLEFGNDRRFRLLLRPIFRSGSERDRQLKICPLEKAAKFESEFLLYLWEKLGFPDSYFYEVLLPSPKAVYCYGGLSGCWVIGANGKLWKCTVALDENSSLGYLEENGTLNINHQKLSEWQSDMESWIYDDECQECIFLPLCVGGCILSRKKGKKGCYILHQSITRAMEMYYTKKYLKGGE